MNILIGVNLYAGIERETLQSLINCILHTHQVKPSINITYCQTARESLPLARIEVIDKAIYGSFEYVFFVGKDIVLPPDALVRLLEYKLDVISGLYFERKSPYHALVYKLVDKYGNPLTNRIKTGCYGGPIGDYSGIHWSPYTAPELEDGQRVDGVGHDCLLISRKVFEQMSQDSYKGTQTPIDLTLSNWFRQRFIDVHISTSVRCGHVTQIKRIITYKDNENALIRKTLRTNA